MGCSLFGKLAAKRDFVAVYAPRDFLQAWEPWMQGGISASRHALGETWQQVFLTAPIWRFWLGADICGVSTAGAFMPSLDGIGRYYPLTLFACARPGFAIPPPDIDAQEAWFSAAEDFLLATLDRDSAYDEIARALDRLSAPAQQATPSLPEGMSAAGDGAVAAFALERPLPDLLACLRTTNHASVYAAASFWWTAGGSDYRPLALCCRRMPDPFLFTTMLTGRITLATQ
jgi:type VI secretion system protein ImpM